MSIFLTFFTHGSIDDVPEPYRAEFFRELTLTNIRRIRAMLVFGVIGCVGLVFAVDILNILHLQPDENRIVLTMHLVLLGIILCFAVPVFMRPVRSTQDLTRFHNVLLKAFFVVVPFAPQTLIHAIIVTKGHPIFLFLAVLMWYSSLLQPPRVALAAVLPLLAGLWLQLALFTPISDGGQFVGESLLFSLAVSAVMVIASGFLFRSAAESFARRKIIEEERNRVAELNAELRTAYLETETMNQELLSRQEMLEEQAMEIEIINTQLHEQNEVLVALHEEKSELLAIVSHDLKNPIAAVRGLAEILQTDMVEPEQVPEIIGHITTNADRMLDLVKNLLDVHRLESGGWSFSARTFDIVPVVQAVLKEYVIAAQAKNIRLHYSSEHPEDFVWADEQAVKQVLDNLLSNAVKYSPLGKNIWIRIKSEGGNMKQDTLQSSVQSSVQSSPLSLPSVPLNAPSFLRLEVQDEGPGISPEDMKKLFGKFARLSARPTGGEHSTGLGLSIVKKMVEAMNGRVWCESEQGKGSTFIVKLPTHA